MGLAPVRNPAGRAGTQPTGCLSAPARTFAAPAPWGWLGGFAMQGRTSDALSTIRCGWRPPSQPTRSGKTYPSDATLPKISIPLLQLLEDIGRPAEGNSSCFRRRPAKRCSLASSRRAESAGRGANARAALGPEISSPPEMRRDDEPREVRQVISPIETPLFAAHFVHADRPYHALEAKFRLRQAAGLFRSPLLFLAQGAPKQSPRTNQRR